MQEGALVGSTIMMYDEPHDTNVTCTLEFDNGDGLFKLTSPVDIDEGESYQLQPWTTTVRGPNGEWIAGIAFVGPA